MPGRELILTDNGTVEFKEAKANGVHGITLQGPASLAADFTLTLFDTLPGSTQFLTVDATGQLGVSTGSSSSLDNAYDGGSVITADAGPVEAAGAGGFLASHSAPVYGLETTGVERNYRLTAGQTAGLFAIQVGDADGDISDDTFLDAVVVDGANRILKVVAPVGNDASVVFNENATDRFQIGYDDSAGGLLVSGTAFGTLDALFVEDSTGDIGINELTPDAKVHVTSAENLIAVFESTESGSGVGSIALVDKDTTDNTQVRVSAVGNDLQLTAAAAALLYLDGANGRVGVGDTTPSAKLDVLNLTASQIACFINQDANGEALRIDSEATSLPLINLLPVTGNSRGDIAFGTARTGNPATPSDGDLWYNGSTKRFMARLASTNIVVAGRLANLGGSDTDDIFAGEVTTAGGGVLTVQAESGTADNLDTITVTNVQVNDLITLVADAGDTITVRHNVGNIHLDSSANKTLTNGNSLTLRYDGTDWVQFCALMTLP